MMVIVGDRFGNCVDGVIMAARFWSGAGAWHRHAVAHVAHEVRQQVDSVLLHPVSSMRQASWSRTAGHGQRWSRVLPTIRRRRCTS